MDKYGTIPSENYLVQSVWSCCCIQPHSVGNPNIEFEWLTIAVTGVGYPSAQDPNVKFLQKTQTCSNSYNASGGNSPPNADPWSETKSGTAVIISSYPSAYNINIYPGFVPGNGEDAGPCFGDNASIEVVELDSFSYSNSEKSWEDYLFNGNWSQYLKRDYSSNAAGSKQTGFKIIWSLDTKNHTIVNGQVQFTTSHNEGEVTVHSGNACTFIRNIDTGNSNYSSTTYSLNYTSSEFLSNARANGLAPVEWGKNAACYYHQIGFSGSAGGWQDAEFFTPNDFFAALKTVRYRWRIDTQYYSSKYCKVTWDEMDELVVEGQTENTVTLASTKTWVWNDDIVEQNGFIYSPWFELLPPNSEGYRRIANVRYTNHKGTHFGAFVHALGRDITPTQ